MRAAALIICSTCFAVILSILTIAPLHSVSTGWSDRAEQTRRPRAGDTVEMSVTAYCLDGQTKAGTETRRGVVAADPRVLPLGSVIRVEGLDRRHNRRYIVEDTGRAIKGRELDIYMPSCRAAKIFGRQDARARVIKVGQRKP